MIVNQYYVKFSQLSRYAKNLVVKEKETTKRSVRGFEARY